jgi:hypothetical protein
MSEEFYHAGLESERDTAKGGFAIGIYAEVDPSIDQGLA